MDAALVILDGWGIHRDWPHPRRSDFVNEEPRRDAIAVAETPTFDRLVQACAIGQLRTDGETVGLPEGQMGNSQVGHLTIGAGRVIEQVSRQIDRAIETGTFGALPALVEAIDHVRDHDGRLHLWGLLSDGGVHASEGHLHALVALADDAEVDTAVHVVTDGRDTPPRSAKRYLTPLEQHISRCERVQLATVTGRYLAMDRDFNWARTRRAYEAMVDGVGTRVVADGGESIDAAYDAGESDEFIAPTIIEGGASLDDGDAIIMANFRADRARQLTRFIADIDPAWPFETDPPSVHVATMAEYDRTFDLPVVIEPDAPSATLGSVLADSNRTQLRIAESEKYPHVTYFINGGREVTFPGEQRAIIQSPDVPTYDRAPAMSAAAVTDRTIELVDADDPDVLVLNYANPDMVGHTGDFEATVEAIEAVDHELGRLLDRLPPCHVIVIADHGNAEDMGTPAEPHTAHTTNPVPCLYRAPDGGDGGHHIREGGTLADVTPTILSLLGIDVPEEMTGFSLLE